MRMGTSWTRRGITAALAGAIGTLTFLIPAVPASAGAGPSKCLSPLVVDDFGNLSQSTDVKAAGIKGDTAPYFVDAKIIDSTKAVLATASGHIEFSGWTGSNLGLNIRLNSPIVAVTDDHHPVKDVHNGNYWLAASDGGVFTIGGAPFYGSLGGRKLNAKIVDIASTPTGKGYWLLGADGGVFAFGDAAFYGSAVNVHGIDPRTDPAVAITPTTKGDGYWFVTRSGTVWAYGSPGVLLRSAPIRGAAPVIVDIAATPDGYTYWLLNVDGSVIHGDTGKIDTVSIVSKAMTLGVETQCGGGQPLG